MRKHLALAAFTAAALGAAVLLPSAVSAAPTPKATGSVGTAPLQYMSFNAFDYGAASADKGTVSYANFDYAEAGSNVWDVRGTYPLSFAGGYNHTMTVSSIMPTSPTSSTFTGTGVYDADSSYTWTVTGTVKGSSISFDIVYTGTGAGYTTHGTGTIAPDGSISGSATDSNALTLSFTAPAGSVNEVLSYTASVNCAKVSGTTATFSYVIPSSSPTLSGTPVLFTVTDGGSPAVGHDHVLFSVSSASCDTTQGASDQPVTSGNLVVH